MKVHSYASVDAVRFGADASQVTDLLGAPLRTNITKKGRTELHFSGHIVRLANSTVVEIAANSPVVELSGVAVPFQHLRQFLVDRDSAAFEALGITVSPAYGVTVDPHDPTWFVAFAKSELASWLKYAPDTSLEPARER